MNQCTKNMEDAWCFLWEKLFCPETNLFYDQLGPDGGKERFSNLPSPEEIALQFPNPCGWGTGMEDCMLNAGSVLDVLRLRRELAGEDNAGRAVHVVAGIRLCAEVHGKKGFLVRGVSPIDGKSCYGNSSRDQITLAVYGLWRFLRCYPDASEDARRQAKDILVSIARYCEKTITPENGYDYLRLDGRHALVSTLWNCDVHEMLRLPMLYAAAYESSGDAHWRSMAERLLPEGMSASEKINPDIYWWDIPIAQMQLSLVLLRECGLFPEYASRFSGLMERVARIAEKEFLSLLVKAEQFHGEWSPYLGNWREFPMKVCFTTFSADRKNVVYDGKTYLGPEFPNAYQHPASMMRGLGNYLFSMLFSPEYRLSEELEKRFTTLLSRIDFTRSTGCPPVNLLHAYWMIQKTKRNG